MLQVADRITVSRFIHVKRGSDWADIDISLCGNLYFFRTIREQELVRGLAREEEVCLWRVSLPSGRHGPEKPTTHQPSCVKCSAYIRFWFITHTLIDRSIHTRCLRMHAFGWTWCFFVVVHPSLQMCNFACAQRQLEDALTSFNSEPRLM